MRAMEGSRVKRMVLRHQDGPQRLRWRSYELRGWVPWHQYGQGMRALEGSHSLKGWFSMAYTRRQRGHLRFARRTCAARVVVGSP